MRASMSLKAVLFSGIGFSAMAMASAASAQETAAAGDDERTIVVTGTSATTSVKIRLFTPPRVNGPADGSLRA